MPTDFASFQTDAVQASKLLLITTRILGLCLERTVITLVYIRYSVCCSINEA